MEKLLTAIDRALREKKLQSEHKQAINALQRSEELYRTLIEGMNEGVMMADIHDKILFVNNQFCKITGYDFNELIGKSSLDSLVEIEDRIKIEQKIKLHNQGIKDYYEVEIIQKGGTKIWVKINGSPLLDSEKKVIGSIAVFEDINEKKLNEKKLEQQQILLSNIIDAVPDLIFIKDCKGNYLGCNKAFEEYSGRPKTEQIGKNDFDFFDKVLASQFREMDNQLLIKNQHQTNEGWVTYPDGHKVLLETIKTPFYGNNSEVKGIVGISRNITQRYYAKIELRKLSSAVEQSPVAITITDINGIIEYVNPKECEMTGYSREEMIGKKPSILRSSDTKDETYADLNNTIAKGKEWRGELHNKKKNGELYWAYEAITAIHDNEGVITHFLAVKEDVTEQKRLISQLEEAKERALASDRLKTAFLNNISHEIRTPLNGILGFGQLIKEPGLTDEEKEEYYEILEKSSDRLTKTITDIVDISLIISDNLFPHFDDFELNALIYELFDFLEVNCNNKNISCKLKLASSDQITMNSDAHLLKKSIKHILDNALKFTKFGEISFGYELNDKGLTIFVKDTGIGIDNEAKDFLFDLFMQEDVSNTRSYEGNGLGLSIASLIIRKLGGRIEIQSEKDKGSTFFIIFPKKSYKIS